MALPRGQPTLQIRYGPASTQVVDVFTPQGTGPHPVAILVHGGCWSSTTAGREQLRHLGAELATRGVATWSIGYRRADDPGGGYPGTYLDIAMAFDRLRDEAPRLGFDLSRSVAIGHSAGGHLALWAAARAGLPSGSPLRVQDPFLPKAVISIAGIGDLRAFAPYIPLICGPGIAGKLQSSGNPPDIDPFDDVSPAALAPSRGPVVLISAVLDRLVPPYVAYGFEQTMRCKGKDDIELVHVQDAGHFDPVTSGTPAWRELLRRVEQLLLGSSVSE